MSTGNWWVTLIISHEAKLKKMRMLTLKDFGMEIWALTLCLLTHVLCKPTHLFFHLLIDTMSFTLQTRFSSVMKDWADKYHIWGTPTRSPFRSNSRSFKHASFHTKKNTYTCVPIWYLSFIRVVSCLLWRDLLCFIISHTYMECIYHWKVIKDKQAMLHAYNKDKKRSIVLKRWPNYDVLWTWPWQ